MQAANIFSSHINSSKQRSIARLSPEINRILYVRNLPFKITTEELYELFGRFGLIRQIRIGVTSETKGSAYVVYDDIFDAKNACEQLSGYNTHGRYLVVLYHQLCKQSKKVELERKERELKELQLKYGMV